MKYKNIPSFTTVDKSTHPRVLKDEILSDANNIYFKNNKVRTRWGYSQIGQQLSGRILGLGEYTKLREESSNLIAITENTTYQYDEATDTFTEFAGSHETGTIDSQIGTPVAFNAVASTYHSVCAISNTQVVAVYENGSTTYGYGVVGTRTGSTIVWSSTPVVFAVSSTYLSICAISATQVVAVYRNNSTSYGYGVVGTVSGTGTSATIVWSSTPVVFNAASSTFLSICAISATQVVAVYENGSTTYGYGVVGTVSGTGTSATIVWSSTPVLLTTTYSTFLSICAISATQVVAVYENGSTTYGYGVVGTVSGTGTSATIVWSSTPVVFNAASSTYLSICAINATQVVGTYATTGYGYGVVGTVSGTGASATIVWSSSYNFYTSLTYPSICALNSTQVAVCYNKTSSYAYTRIGTISGTGASASISWGTEVAINSVTASPSGETLKNCSLYNVALSFDVNYGFIAIYRDGSTTYGNGVAINTNRFTGTSVTWSMGWPDDTYQIKFGTTDINGTGTPDVWYTVHEFETTTCLTISDVLEDILFTSGSNDYVIRQTFLSSSTDFFDSCNIIEGLGDDDEKQILFTNYVDPPKIFDGTTLSSLTFDGDGYSAPLTLAKYCAYYYDHVVLAYCNDGTYELPQSVYWNYRGYPTYWSTGSAGYADLTEGDDRITGMEKFKQRLYIFKEDSIVECYYTQQTSPAFEFTQDLIKEIGCPWGRTIINCGDQIIFRGRDNIYTFNGKRADPIGDQVIQDINDNEDEDYQALTFSALLKREQLYLLFYVATGSTTPNKCWVYNYLKNSWTPWSLYHGMTTFATYKDNYIVLGDTNGNVYLMDFTSFDDDGENIEAYLTTKDFDFQDENGNSYSVKLLETILTTETNAGNIQISLSLDYGDSWTNTMVIDQNTANNIYEHIINWLQRGRTVRVKIQNLDGSKFAIENLMLGFEMAGTFSRR